MNVPSRMGSGLVMAAAVLSLLGAACGGGRGPSEEAPAAPEATAAVRLPASPTELPDFTPAAFRQLRTSLKGTPVLVNIWASWCGPCYQEAPALAAMAKEFEGRVQFIGVDIVDHRGPATEFIKQFGWSFPSVFDQDGAIRDDLGLIGQPHTIIYDASGTQTFLWSGAVNEVLLMEELSKVATA
jgi:cytochrome c biogenesis protein CcmG/thiol:disulfide interchange protein DsbE